MTWPRRIAGNLALDFANTVSWRGTDREIDHLADLGGLLDWARAAELEVDAAALPAGAGVSILTSASRLRDAIGAIGSAFAARRPLPGDALTTLRDAAAGALSRAVLAGDPLRPRFSGQDRLLGTVAWAALDLFTGAEVTRIKECPFHDCRWLFIDRSRNGSRRWCEMSTCGNRAKKQAMMGLPSDDNERE
jgi:predicted RNA-binding Zn ribbon-like protein